MNRTKSLFKAIKVHRLLNVIIICIHIHTDCAHLTVTVPVECTGRVRTRGVCDKENGVWYMPSEAHAQIMATSVDLLAQGAAAHGV